MGAKSEALEKLIRLQALDEQVRKLRAELDEKPKLIAREKQQLEEARARLAAAEKKARDAHMAADRKELDVRTREAAILKVEGQLNSATSNKVYSDLLLNIRGARADIEKLEDSILGMMDEAEGLEAEVEKVRVEVRNAEDEFREAEKVFLAQSTEVEGRLVQRQGMRDLLAREVDPEVLSTYDRVREARRGIGITTVTVDGEGDHFCSACQMTVTIQDLSVALAAAKVVQCRSCNRILCVEALPGQPEQAE